tara:strand:- start:293 stop:556 length:264 start_codon:yes stop_codon:yes gene_type:complete
MENQMKHTTLKNGITLVETLEFKRMKKVEERLLELETLKLELPKLILELYWEYGRMSNNGCKSLDKLARLLNIPDEDQIENLCLTDY